MGDLSTDTINVGNNIGITDAEAIAPLTDLIGLIGDIGSVAGGINSIVTIVESWLGTDQLTQINKAIAAVSTAIQNGFDKLGRDLNAQQILLRNSNINAIISDPTTWYGLLNKVIGKQLTTDEINQYVEPCLKALAQFDGSAQPDLVWYSTFDWQIFWTDAGLFSSTCYAYPYTFSIDPGFGQQAPAEDSSGNVFNYTFCLPVYLQAVWFFLTVAGALDPDFPRAYNGQLTSISNHLTARYNLIMTNGQGLTTVSPANWTGAGLINTPCPGGSAESVGIRLQYQQPVNLTSVVIQGAVIEYGAVEKFSACSSVTGSYQIDFTGPSDPFDPAIFHKLQVRLLKHTMDVYRSVGLYNVWQAINSVNVLAGAEPLPTSTYQWSDGSLVDLTRWSFRQVFALSRLTPTSGTYSLRALANFLIGTKPFDTPYSPGATNVSCQNLLTDFPN